MNSDSLLLTVSIVISCSASLKSEKTVASNHSARAVWWDKILPACRSVRL